MTLRARLVLAVTALLVGVIVTFGYVAAQSHRRVLLAQIDQRLGSALAQAARLQPGGGGAGGDRIFAQLILDPNGEVVASAPSGIRGDLDPLPDISALPDLQPGDRRVMTLPAVGGNFAFRAGVLRSARGFTLIVAQPLRDVTAAGGALSRRLFAAGVVILTGGGAVFWLTLRRGLRPVDDMIATAAAIADGDLSRRVPEADSGTELGKLGSALNHMLANIEQAFEAETRAKLRLKQFVADASHELRTPIATISGYTELHRKGALDPDPGTDHAMSRIESESRRMKHLVEDLLLLARLDLDQPLERQPVDLSRIAHDAAADSRAIDPQRPVDEVIEEGLLVSGNPERLTQVIANLLQNARSHTPPGTPIQIKVGRSNGMIELAVSDRGPGFPLAALGSVFDRFFRADDSRSRKSGGSGLGLAIVEAIARAHGGSARAENLPDAGARVIVRLPALG
ncbi:MAG TPA: HAMP domain-containing sensor histidine kinase [Acidimicrobiia bacterium]|nr:HAMP domain-containing sensor histidine kinase [Acidimicrobiia bacterium]